MSVLVLVEDGGELAQQALTFARAQDPDVDVVAFGEAPSISGAGTIHVAQIDGYAPQAWARAIAYYLVLAFRKERSRQREYFTEQVIQLLDEAYAKSSESVGQSREALVECLAKLPAAKQKLVTDYYSPGGAAELARTLGMTANSLRQAVHRIRRMLHECVQRTIRAEQSH